MTKDNCREVEPLLALAASEDLAPEERTKVDRHLKDCSSCSSALADYLNIRNDLSAMKSSFNKRVLDIDAHVGRSAFTERTRLSRNLGFAAAALVLLIGLIVFRSADVPPSVPVASMRDPARTERSVDHILLKGNGVFVEQPVVRLADTANESDSRVVSTIYTDNPDIVIAWIGD